MNEHRQNYPQAVMRILDRSQQQRTELEKKDLLIAEYRRLLQQAQWLVAPENEAWHAQASSLLSHS